MQCSYNSTWKNIVRNLNIVALHEFISKLKEIALNDQQMTAKKV